MTVTEPRQFSIIPGSCEVALGGGRFCVRRRTRDGESGPWTVAPMSIPADSQVSPGKSLDSLRILAARRHEWLIDLLVCFRHDKTVHVLEVWRISPYRVLEVLPVGTVPAHEEISSFHKGVALTPRGFRLRSKQSRILVRAQSDETTYFGYGWDFKDYDVFISYKDSRPSRGVARGVADALTAAGVKVWLDKDEIRGDDYDDELQRGLRASASFVVVWSEKSLEPAIAGGGEPSWSQAKEIATICGPQAVGKRVLHYAVDGTRVPKDYTKGRYHVARHPELREGEFAELWLQRVQLPRASR